MALRLPQCAKSGCAATGWGKPEVEGTADIPAFICMAAMRHNRTLSLPSSVHGVSVLLNQLLQTGRWRMERRLSGILTADVVDYSRMMDQDEAGTHAWKEVETLDPLISQHHGQIVRLMGDVTVPEARICKSDRNLVDIQRYVLNGP